MTITNDDIIRFLEGLSTSELAAFADKVQSQLGLPLIPAVIRPSIVTGTSLHLGELVGQPSFSVVLTGAGPNKIVVIKALRELLSLGLKEAKDMVETPPVVLREDIPRNEANSLASRLRDAGAVVEIR